MKFSIKAAAQRDLREIAAYVARDNPGRAISYIAELNRQIRTAAERPLSFPARDEWRKGLRSALHGQYHVIFEIADETVVILRIVHGARDIGSLF
jgi:toxin ParE1/3/4